MAQENCFFVCLYKDKENKGQFVGHSISSSSDFSKDFEKQLTIKAKEIAQKSAGSLKSASSEKYEKKFRDFVESMKGFMDMLPIIGAVSGGISKSIQSNSLKSYLSENSTQIDDCENCTIYSVPNTSSRDFHTIDKNRNNAQRVAIQTPKMLILGIVSSFEYHMSELLKCILIDKPQILDDKSTKITLKELEGFDSIED